MNEAKAFISKVEDLVFYLNDGVVENHEERLDELENMVRPNTTGTPDPSTTHQKRIEALEEKVEALEKKLAEQAP